MNPQNVFFNTTVNIVRVLLWNYPLKLCYMADTAHTLKDDREAHVQLMEGSYMADAAMADIARCKKDYVQLLRVVKK